MTTNTSHVELQIKDEMGLRPLLRGKRPELLPLDLGSIPCAAILNGSFILATSAIHLITVVSGCLLDLTEAKVMLNFLIHPASIMMRQFDVISAYAIA